MSTVRVLTHVSDDFVNIKIAEADGGAIPMRVDSGLNHSHSLFNVKFSVPKHLLVAAYGLLGSQHQSLGVATVSFGGDALYEEFGTTDYSVEYVELQAYVIMEQPVLSLKAVLDDESSSVLSCDVPVDPEILKLIEEIDVPS